MECDCGCGEKYVKKPIEYKCDCEDEDCKCCIIGFDEEPKSPPYCCGKPMKRV